MTTDRREGPRKDGRPVNRTVLHVTHMIVGVAIGYFVGGNGYLLARWLHGQASLIVNNMWWMAMLVIVIEMFVLREIMDAIRETVFIEYVDGEAKETRRRRRHEVVMTIVKRAIVVMVLGAIVLTGLYHLGLHYKDDFVWLQPLFSGRGLPPIAQELILVFYCLVIGFISLVICESTLRSTQKRGFPWQVICLFIPAALGVGLACQLFSRFAG